MATGGDSMSTTKSDIAFRYEDRFPAAGSSTTNSTLTGAGTATGGSRTPLARTLLVAVLSFLCASIGLAAGLIPAQASANGANTIVVDDTGTASGTLVQHFGLLHDVATAFDGLSLIVSTGNITGTIAVRGIA